MLVLNAVQLRILLQMTLMNLLSTKHVFVVKKIILNLLRVYLINNFLYCNADIDCSHTLFVLNDYWYLFTVCKPYYEIKQFKNEFNCTIINDHISCTVTCKNGYVFLPEHPPKEIYECGNNTNFVWSYTPPACVRK